MTAVNENGQVYWTFEDLDLYMEYQEVTQLADQFALASRHLDDMTIKRMKNDERYSFTKEYKDLRAASHYAYRRFILLTQVADLLYGLFIKGETFYFNRKEIM